MQIQKVSNKVKFFTYPHEQLSHSKDISYKQTLVTSSKQDIY